MPPSSLVRRYTEKAPLCSGSSSIPIKAQVATISFSSHVFASVAVCPGGIILKRCPIVGEMQLLSMQLNACTDGVDALASVAMCTTLGEEMFQVVSSR